MKIELTDIKDFQCLWKDQFHQDISETQAYTKAIHLMEMMKVVYRPLPKPIKNQQLSILSPKQYNHEIQPI